MFSASSQDFACASESAALFLLWRQFAEWDPRGLRAFSSEVTPWKWGIFPAFEACKFYHSRLLMDHQPLTSISDPPVGVSGVSQRWNRPVCTHQSHINHRRSLLAGCYSFNYPSHSGFISTSYHPSERSGYCGRNLVPCDETNAHFSHQMEVTEGEGKWGEVEG